MYDTIFKISFGHITVYTHTNYFISEMAFVLLVTVYFSCNWGIVTFKGGAGDVYSVQKCLMRQWWKSQAGLKTQKALTEVLAAWRTEHPHAFIPGFEPTGLVGIWRHNSGHCCTVGWVTQCSREEMAPLSLLLALARDLHIFLLEALKEYKKD